MDTYELLEQRYTVHRLRKKELIVSREETYLANRKELLELTYAHYYLENQSPDSSIHGILQTRILEWVATSFSKINHKDSQKE